MKLVNDLAGSSRASDGFSSLRKFAAGCSTCPVGDSILPTDGVGFRAAGLMPRLGKPNPGG